MNKVCVVIPMYGQEAYTRKCIELTIKNAGVPVDILVVDDGSPEPFKYENTMDQIVAVFRIPENTGYTNAQNEGILWCGDMYEYIHCLNNDTEPYPNFIKFLLDEMEKDKEIAIASSVRIYPKENLAELYGIDLIRGYQCVMKPEDLKDQVIECNWVPMCSSLVRTSIFRELGVLNKQMRTHSSDLEYCLRVKIAQHKIVVVTRSQVIHHHEVTTKANNVTPEKDQRVLLEILAGLNYQQFMSKIPLDAEQKLYGKITFELEKR